MLAANNFTAMANKTTPKILRITLIPCFPKTRSIFPEDFNTKYTIIIFIKIAIIILIVWYSARSESIEVIVPAPATKGNASGTIAAVSGASSL